MKEVIKSILLCSLLISLPFFYLGCKKETPTEKAEKEIKKTLDKAKKKLKDLTD